jgi:hypothetical protein
VLKPDVAEVIIARLEKAADDGLEALRKKFNLEFKTGDPIEVPINFEADVASSGKPIDGQAFAESAGVKAIAQARGVLELALLKSGGKERLDAKIKLLEDDRENELANTELTQSQRAVIEEKYRQMRSDLEAEYYIQMADMIVSWAAQVSTILTDLAALRSNKEQDAFEKEMAQNEKRKDGYKKLLDNKLITQAEYDKRVARLDAQAESRQKELAKKQFERDKNAQTVQATMNAAQAVIATLAARPGSLDIISLGAFRAIQLGIIGATLATQIATIRSSKPPQFAEGGFIPQGSSHRDGGISLIDNRTGASVGEVEGGEPIISKKVYASNKPLIDSLISQGGGTMSMNIPNLNKAMRTVLETGGFIPRSGEANNGELLTAINTLNAILSKPIRSNVIFGEFEEKSDMINSIRAQSMIS